MRHGGKRVWVSQTVSRQLSFVVDFLGLRRNVVVLSLAIFCVGLGFVSWRWCCCRQADAQGWSPLSKDREIAYAIAAYRMLSVERW
jgi:hypothetical protein